MCGLVATIEDGRVRGDRDNALSRRFACSKGLASPELHNGPKRLVHPAQDGASTTRLVARDHAIETINAMPCLSGIPVRIERL